jgi:hypothetical protein
MPSMRTPAPLSSTRRTRTSRPGWSCFIAGKLAAPRLDNPPMFTRRLTKLLAPLALRDRNGLARAPGRRLRSRRSRC